MKGTWTIFGFPVVPDVEQQNIGFDDWKMSSYEEIFSDLKSTVDKFRTTRDSLKILISFSTSYSLKWVCEDILSANPILHFNKLIISFSSADDCLGFMQQNVEHESKILKENVVIHFD